MTLALGAKSVVSDGADGLVFLFLDVNVEAGLDFVDSFFEVLVFLDFLFD